MTPRDRNRRPRHAPQLPMTREKTTAQPLPTEEVKALAVVDMAALAITDSRAKIFTAGEKRQVSRFFNDGPFTVYTGGKNVDASNGMPVEPGQGWNENEAPDADWYAVCATGETATIRRTALQ